MSEENKATPKQAWAFKVNHITQEMFDAVAGERISKINSQAEENINKTGAHLSDLLGESIAGTKLIALALNHMVSKDIPADDLIHSLLVAGIRLGFVLGNLYPDPSKEG